MRSTLILALLILLGNNLSIAQPYTIFTDTVGLGPGPEDYSVDFGNLQLSDCTENTASISAGAFINALTYATDGAAYAHGIINFVLGFDPGLFRVSGVDFGIGYGIAVRIPSPRDPFITAMGCGYNNELYTAGWAIQRYHADPRRFDWEFDSLSFRGFLPVEMRAAGGMTHRDGEYYITTVSNTLVKVDVENAMNSEVVATFPDNEQVFDAMISFPHRCDSIVTYVFGRDTTGTTVYTLDFEDYSLEEYCRLDKKIFAVATPEECIKPPCEMYVDLDEDDSAGLSIFDYQIDTICRSFTGIGDLDTKVFSALEIDSIVVELVEHPDGLEDQLYEPMSTPEITVARRLSFWKFALLNNGTATFEDFENLLKEFSYANIKTDLTHGPRAISVQAFAKVYRSEPALMRFYIGDGGLDLNPALDLPSCFGQSDGTIRINPSGAPAPYDISWENGSTADSLENLAAGPYALTLTAGDGCTLQDTIRLPEPALLSLELVAQNDTICGSSGQIEAVVQGGTGPYAFFWEDGSDQASRSGIAAGTYSLSVEDAIGCGVMETITLLNRDTVYTSFEQNLCEGEEAIIDNISYTTDTSFCISYQTVAGCDSIHCVNLVFQDSILQQEQVILCPGEVYPFNGFEFSRDTSLCWIELGSNGCDSTFCLTIDVLDEPTPLEASICPGDTYFFAGADRTQPGTYRDTLVGSQGCDSIIALRLSHFPLPNIQWEQDGSLCTQAEVTLSGGIHTSYLWSDGSSGASLTISTPGRYTLKVENEQACSATDSVDVVSNDLNFGVLTTTPQCPGEDSGSLSIMNVFGGVGPYLYALDGMPFQGNPQFTGLPAGTYSLVVEDAEGCRATSAVELEDPTPIGLVGPDDLSIKLGDTVPVNLVLQNENVQLTWSPPLGLACDTCISTVVFPSHTTAYRVAATDQEACQEEVLFRVVVDRALGLFIPNAISPNDDGVNDYLQIFTDASIRQLSSLQIFDRWGALIYEKGEVVAGEQGWDGTYNGQLLPTGVYIFQVQIERADGQKEKVSGEILLLK